MKKKSIRFLIISLFSLVAYFILSIPFINNDFEFNPSAVLNPFLGCCFGLPSAIGIMISNALIELISGYSFVAILEGLIPQFLYTYIPYLLWKRFTKGEDHIHRLDSVARVLRYAFIVIVFAVISSICKSAIKSLNEGVELLEPTKYIFLNNFDMGIILGCPLMIAMNQYMARRYGNNRKLCENEIIILSSASLQFVVVGLIVLITFINKTKNVSINQIYINSTFAVNLIMAFALLAMIVVEGYKNDKNKEETENHQN